MLLQKVLYTARREDRNIYIYVLCKGLKHVCRKFPRKCCLVFSPARTRFIEIASVFTKVHKLNGFPESFIISW